ncbi:FAT domain-containing protein, partial [Zopfochytrium polystomum]
MEQLLNVVKTDNEENALVAIKVINDLHRTYRQEMETFVKDFLDIVLQMYQNMKQAVKDMFEADGDPPTGYLRSMFSFKTLTECPAIIVLFIHSFGAKYAVTFQIFMPALLEVLALQPTAQATAHEAATATGKPFIGMSPDIKNKTAYVDFKSMQTKTVSFIAFSSKHISLRQSHEAVASAIMTLLKDCPPESSSARKDLLIAARHLCSKDCKSDVDFRNSFRSYIEMLMDENVLLGTSVTVRETQRSWAYSVLVELIQQMRADLSWAQLGRVLSVYCRHLHDYSFSPSSQVICLRFLLSLVEAIGDKAGASEVRRVYVGMLECIALKFTAMKAAFPATIKMWHKRKSTPISINHENMASGVELESFMDLGLSQPIRTTARPFDQSPDLMKEAKLLLKTMIQGIRQLVVGLKAGMTPDADMNLILHYEEEDGLKCFNYFAAENFGPDGALLETSDKASPSVSKDEREVFELFASVFTLILAPNMEYFPTLQALPHYFLGVVNSPQPVNNPVSPHVAGLLLTFLSGDQVYSACMLRLFKVVFMSNESVLRPYIGLSSQCEDPMNYFMLLRALFRSIVGGRFEALFQEVLPLLEVLLEGLNNLLVTAQKKQMKELFAELCLSVPVRLTVLLPYLSLLMKPLVLALQSGPDLVSQGLRTLELCVDNLTQDFLEPIMAPVLEDLMNALWSHLQPFPYKTEHSHSTMRILGKLGGRNRKLLKSPMRLNYNENLQSGIIVSFQFQASEQLHYLSLDKPLDVALRVMEDANSSEFSRKQALCLAKSLLPLLIDFKHSVLDWKILQETSMDIDLMGGANEVTEHSDSPFSDAPMMPRDKREVQDKALCKILTLLFAGLSVSEFKDEVSGLLNDLCRHFALLCVAEHVDVTRKKPSYPENADASAQMGSQVEGFIDALVKGITASNSDYQQRALDSLKLFYSTCKEKLAEGSVAAPHELQVFHSLASKFCSSCYKQDRPEKKGGCLGIFVLIVDLDLGLNWVMDHELEFAKALLYVLKDTAPEFAARSVDEATSTLIQPLESEDGSSERHPKFNSLISLLISELSNSNRGVREAIQSSFDVLAKLTSTNVTDLLLPVRDRLLSPIFSKPLRALPFAMQIGHIDAITYCLNLRPSLLTFSEELVRLLHEALALADAEDQALVSKPTHYKNSSSLTNLRVVCIKLLSSAMSCPDFAGQTALLSTRARIISVFFKSLYSKSPEVVDFAYKGLHQVLSQQHKLPKELLQAGLKPILVNLSDYKKLTVSALEGLARLLELLTNYFKVEIGRKLLDHLRQWADPAMLENAANRPTDDIEEIKVIVAILDVFHLLPQTANIFLDDLINVLLALEAKVRRIHSSPFRPPLIKFMNRYPTDTVDYFLERLGHQSFSRFFLQVLGSPSAQQLRSEVIGNISKLLAATYEHVDTRRASGAFIVGELLKHEVDWLLNEPSLLSHLKAHWLHIQGLQMPLDQLSSDGQEVRQVLDIFIVICSKNHNELDLLFYIMEAFRMNSLQDLTFVKIFLYNEVFQHYTPGEKRLVLQEFFQRFKQGVISQQMAAVCLRFLITPMLQTSFSKNDVGTIIDTELIEGIHTQLWRPSAENGESGNFDDALKLEILQLLALLLQYAHDFIVNEARKDVIKYAWTVQKMEDLTCKQAAYVVNARFIRQIDTTAKLVAPVYVALLRNHQPDCKTLVKQALDILVPVIPIRLGHTGAGIPTWVRWIRKILIGEGHTLPQLVSILQLIIRHADQFLESRDQFIPHIVSSLNQLGLAPSSTIESKTLAMDLAEVVVKWCQSVESVTIPASVGSGHDDADATGGSAGNNFKELLITFFIRFMGSMNEAISSNSLTFRCKFLTQECLDLWPDINIRYSFFEKIASMPVADENMLILLNSAELLATILDRVSPMGTVGNLPIIQKCIEPWLHSDNPQIIKSLSPILDSLFKAMSSLQGAIPDAEPLAAQFSKNVEETITQSLQNNSNVSLFVPILAVFCKYHPEFLEEKALADVMRHFQKLVKDHLSVIAQATGPPDNGKAEPAELIELLHILKVKVPFSKEHRRTFHDSLVQLVSESIDTSILRVILGIAKDWILFKQDSFPTLKEKANLMVKMMIFETRGEAALFDEYLSIVAAIYSEPALARSELTVRLERAFLIGTSVQNPTMRRNFVDMLGASLNTSVYNRLHYIIGVQNWEPIGGQFWLAQSLDLLIGCINVDGRICDASTSTRISNPLCHFYTDLEDTVIGVLEGSQFSKTMLESPLGLLFSAIREMIFLDTKLAAHLWTEMFPMCWSVIRPAERQTLSKLLVPLLARDFHLRQASARPNVAATFLESVCKSTPSIQLPAQLVKYIGKTYNAWHTALDFLQNLASESTLKHGNVTSREEERLRDSPLDALADILWKLSEEDYFYGLWRRRCLFAETNSAISFEQCGLWPQAQVQFENAQMKARSGVLPFTEPEYILWEEHWSLCAQKLQQWDILTDLAKQENDPDLLLECAWRLSDWSGEKEVISATIPLLKDAQSPRKKIYEAFLVMTNPNGDKNLIRKLCDEGVQLMLQQWIALPSRISSCHVPILHQFQLFVELHEATQIQEVLTWTTAANIEQKTVELRGFLQSWRERLPNMWDDINLWSDLVHWRQHIFSLINKAYLPLIPQLSQPPANPNNPTISYAYRGYHETAWIINRFSHIARKHQLMDVCISSLSKIYTLPNIEIPEAFYKLREQAKCHFQSPAEYATGLDVINNTNLMYFSNAQKAEFWTLKGIFLSKLKLNPEANTALSSANMIDTSLAKGWAAWGQFNDELFKTKPKEIKHGVSAVSCYLHAAGIYSNGRSRKYIARLLWLLSLDDEGQSMMKVYENFKGETPLWFWITFIPQLLTALSNKEARYARVILMRLAKAHPQALHFQLRTTKEHYTMIKKQAVMAAATSGRPAESAEDTSNDQMDTSGSNNPGAAGGAGGASTARRQPWEYLDEVMALLKTAFPLLALTMETMVDQLSQRLKPTTDEDIYRLIVALLNDGVQQLAKDPSENGALCQAT